MTQIRTLKRIEAETETVNNKTCKLMTKDSIFWAVQQKGTHETSSVQQPDFV